MRSGKHFFVRFGIEIWAAGASAPIFSHIFDARDRAVLIQFPAGALGDTLAWFPAAEHFARLHGCRLTVAMRARFIPLLAPMYPSITFITASQADPAAFYATYRVKGADDAYLGSAFATVKVSNGVSNGTYLANDWSSAVAAGARNDLGLAVGQLGTFTIGANAAGSLTTCSISAGGILYVDACGNPGATSSAVSSNGTVLGTITTNIPAPSSPLAETVTSNDLTLNVAN